MREKKKKKGWGKKVYIKSGEWRLVSEKGKLVWIKVKEK